MHYFNSRRTRFNRFDTKMGTYDSLETGGVFGTQVMTWRLGDYCLSKIYSNGLCVHSLTSQTGLLSSHREAIKFTKKLLP